MSNLFILIGVLILFYSLRRGITVRKKRLIALTEEWSSHLSHMEEYIAAYEDLIKEQRFISGYEISQFRSNNSQRKILLDGNPYRRVKGFNRELLKKYRSIIRGFENNIHSFNKAFVQNELENTRELLNHVEGQSLDEQQRKAVIINEDNQLVIAGAGSGKTTTIIGKVKYLTQKLHIEPNRILLLSFTRKSADEMESRLRVNMGSALPVMTFHKLGLSIISKVTNEKPTIYDSTGKSHKEVITSFLNHLKTDEEYSSRLVEFLTFYLRPYKDINDFESGEEHENYLKEQGLVGYKTVSRKNRNGVEITYRERYKSQEEVAIANFLFLNNIEYIYEESYEKKTASRKFGQYKPDFFLPEYNLYLEHFGIDENGNVPPFFKGKGQKSAKQVYNEGIEWKRKLHASNNTRLIETYSWYQRDGVLLERLQGKLESAGVVFRKMSKDELWSYIGKVAGKEIDDFTELITTFLSQFKTRNEQIDEFEDFVKKRNIRREILFLQLFRPLLELYKNHLLNLNAVDFDDMINMATDYVESNMFMSSYDYIIIDEYQDISFSRYMLIKSLIEQSPSTKLFCVGDDWQSIYRFAGSDIGLFTSFEDHFSSDKSHGVERKTEKTLIERTYRFDNQLIKVSSRFISKNPNQIKKELIGNRLSNKKPYTVISYSDPERKWENISEVLKQALDEIDKESPEGATVLLTGRYSFDRNALNNQLGYESYYNTVEDQYEFRFSDFPNLKCRFLTAHRSKGTQDDYVILLNSNSGTFGFPSEITDDPLLGLILSQADQFPNGEERRLFYVAITRAKKHVYFLVNEEYPSKFIIEIDEGFKKVSAQKCQRCDTGTMTLKNGPYGFFMSCTNYHFCNYTSKATNKDIVTTAGVLVEKNDLARAIELFEHLVSVDEFQKVAHKNLASLFARLGEYHKSLIYIDYVLQDSVKDKDVLMTKGSVFFAMSNYHEAIKSWEIVNKSKFGFKNCHHWLIRAYIKSGQPDAAAKLIKKALRKNPNDTVCIGLQNHGESKL